MATVSEQSGMLKVDTDSLYATCTRLSTDINGFKNLLANLSTEVAALDATWKGPNHDRFKKYFEERLSLVKRHEAPLESFHAALCEAATIYQRLEESIGSSVGEAERNIENQKVR